MIRLPAPNTTRCLLVAAALLAFLAAVVSPTNAWAAVSSVRVTATNLSNFDLPVELSSIGDPAVKDTKYTVKDGTVEVTEGYSLKQILDYAADQDAKLDYSQAESVTVGAIRILPGDIDRPGSKPPVFFQTESGLTFVKSETSSSPAAKVDFLTTEPLISIRNRARTTTLPVTLTASDRSIEAGESIDFTAKVNAAAGASLSYTWSLSDGTVKTTTVPELTHRFKKAGTFDVSVAVTDSVSSSSGGGSIQVQVGKVKKEKEKPEGDSGDDTGAYTPPPDYGYSYPGGSGGSGTGSPGGSTGSSAGTPAPQVEQPPAEPVDDGLETISGELVSSTAPAATIDPSLPGAPDALQDGETASDAFGLPREAWVVLGLFALFGFGMLAERRGSRLS